jgi:hypothetical protein
MYFLILLQFFLQYLTNEDHVIISDLLVESHTDDP